ncbi:SusC/RagA family TonB-linked outer membrane protein [Segetibacter sp. 3557_3]|uniref:SusC/RagA family TonB-linked outer membrane protein n=1 Tax=Segetibacter sp. 3557_3 TaxID=2547429 RepID=UPI0010588115|nr:SusC/RagA family TonB-linked outer membrane protein [Segetibacter sp. 3557_3]TDH26392.1 SusC/RagA family TonB-linked outer membrane protein [Segetibacter sp. 3557_3]
MRKIWLLLFIGVMLLTSLLTYAQEKTVTGTIVSQENGTPMEGVTVVNTKTTRSTLSTNTGAFSIRASAGDVLRFSYVSFQSTDVKVSTSNVISVKLAKADRELDQVVVTSLGIKKARRELGYGVTEIKGDEVAGTQRDNFLMSLAGRVPGANITATSGMPGSSVSINLRGVTSLTSNNNPLFVIDGVPIDNKTLGANALITQTENRTIDFANRISDINPDDIESITVLKGPEASALYGLDAGNGVILITTKKGRAGTGRLNYSSNFTVEKVQNLPQLQRVYDQGLNGVTDNNVITYFGPKYAPNTQFFDNLNSFFQTGKAQRHNLSLEGGSDNTTYRFSGAYATRDGVIPTTKYDRLNLGLSGTQKVGRILNLETNLQYINTKNSKVSKGNNSFLLGLMQWPSDVDVTDYLTPGGTRKKFTTLGTEIENPFFDVNKNKLYDESNRFTGNFSLTAFVAPWLTLTSRIGLDNYTTSYSVLYHPESVRGTSLGGSLDQAADNTRLFTATYFATARKTFLKDKLVATARIGGSNYDYRTNVLATRGIGFLDPNFNSLNNTTTTSQRSKVSLTNIRRVSVLGEATLGYDNAIFYTYSARNDWSSTLPFKNNSFFYDAHTLSVVFTEFDKKKEIFGNTLSYGKLRFAYSGVGKDAPPFKVSPAYEAQTTTGGGFSYGFTGPNPNLIPEHITSFEVGTELSFFKSRLTLDVAYYKKTSINQILRDLRGSYATGFILATVNGGELYNKGVEATLSAIPVSNKNFRWNTSVNFNKINSKLVRLSDQIPEFYDSDTWLYRDVRNGVRVGGPLTTFSGQTFQVNNAGQVLINPSTGLPTGESLWKIVGDRNPDFLMGFNNSFTYKDLSLSFLLDLRKGGDVYNATESYMYRNGLSLKTLDRETPRIFDGVLRDGLENTATPTKNNIQIIPYFNSVNFYQTGAADEMFIEHDINWLRLRDVTLSYNISKKLLEKTRFIRTGRIFFTATDLFMITNYTGGDPGVNGTSAAQGGSGGSGFDYGNLPLPRVYNLGLNVSF